MLLWKRLFTLSNSVLSSEINFVEIDNARLSPATGHRFRKAICLPSALVRLQSVNIVSVLLLIKVYYGNQLSSSSPSSVLKDAIVAHMEEIGDTSHEDIVRTFFRRRIADIGGVIQKIKDIVIHSSKSRSSGTNLPRSLSSAIRIVVVST